MAFGSFNRGAPDAPMAEINMIPLIDVMLVLLVIFIITAPLLTHSVKIDLPRAATAPSEARPDRVSLAIDASGRYYWNGEPADRAGIVERMRSAAQRQPQPELELRADRTTQYQALAEVMAAASAAGLVRIGFVSDPRERRAR